MFKICKYVLKRTKPTPGMQWMFHEIVCSFKITFEKFLKKFPSLNIYSIHTISRDFQVRNYFFPPQIFVLLIYVKSIVLQFVTVFWFHNINSFLKILTTKCYDLTLLLSGTNLFKYVVLNHLRSIYNIHYCSLYSR